MHVFTDVANPGCRGIANFSLYGDLATAIVLNVGGIGTLMLTVYGKHYIRLTAMTLLAL